MSKLIIYCVGMITASIICILGLISMDTTVHTEARIGAGILMGATHIAVVLMIIVAYMKREDSRLKIENHTHDVKIRRELRILMAEEDRTFEETLAAIRVACKHDWPYDGIQCNCKICGANSDTYRKTRD